MADLTKLLQGYYIYTEKGFVKAPGLNWLRKIHRIRRIQLPCITDMKPFNAEQKQFEIKQRSKLMQKIKGAIRNGINRDKNTKIRYERHLENVLNNMFKPRVCVENQMEDADAHGFGDMDTNRSGNVVLTEAHGNSALPTGSGMNSEKLCCEDIIGKYPEMAQRWLYHSKIQWKAEQPAGTNLAMYVLPRDFVLNNNTTVNIAPFRYHAYWKGDIEVKVQINSNKFQVGQVQVAWFYGAYRDESFSSRLNNQLISQMYHGLLDAGSSNSVDLYIPYKYHSPMINISKTGKCKDCLNMGNLLIYVLNGLNVPSGQPTTADITIFVRLVDSNFGGTLDSSIIFSENQMETAVAVMAAEKLLRMTGIANTDNPSDVRAPNYVVPTAVHSLSVGTNMMEPLFPLRLDARGQTQNKIGNVINEHNTIYDIARVFGLFHKFDWATGDVAGSEVGSFPAVPNMKFTEYKRVEETSAHYVESRSLPPVAVISSLFAQWRGSLEMRFDVIASQYHTGRLMVAYVPLAEKLATISIEKARSSYHAVFDLQEIKTFTFVVPFVYHDVWYRNANKMGDSDTYTGSIGSVYIFVVNALRAPDTVANKIIINTYIRAGETFEVSIPIQPSLGLNYVRHVRSSGNDEFRADNESSDGLYAGRWDDFPNNLVLRWGILPGRIANFPDVANIFNKGIKSVVFEDPTESIFVQDASAGVCRRKRLRYYFICKRADTWVAFGFTAQATAAKAWNDELQQITPEIETFSCDNGSNPWSATKPLVLYLKKVTTPVENQMERIQSTIVLNPSNTFKSMNGGMEMFGENFHNIKDLCRRYQYFGQYVMRHVDMRNGNGVLFQFPTFPQGIQINAAPILDHVHNKCRDGIIPILMSGFKFYRGSLRFKIVVPVIEGLTFWIQHRPEIIREKNIITFPSAADNEIDMLAYGYGSHMIVGIVNGILEFEVPFYQSGIYGEMGKRTVIDDDSAYFGNGLIVFGYNNIGSSDLSTKLEGTRINIYYSVGDDFQFHTFQGFPPMIDAAAIAQDFPENFIMVENQGLGDVFNKLAEARAIKAADESIIGKKLHDIAESLTNVFKEVFGTGVSKERYIEFSVFLGSQIAHLINNFTAKTMAIVIISVFSYIGIKFSLITHNIILVLEKILESFIGVPKKLLNGNQVNVENQADLEDDENLFTTYISALFTAICIYLKIDSEHKLGDGTLAKLKKLFTVDISNSIRTGNGLYVFLKNHFIIAKHLLKKALTLMFSRHDVIDAFGDSNGVGFRFLHDVRELVDNSKIEVYREEPMFIEKVTACENLGRNLLQAILKTPSDVGSRIHIEVEKSLFKVSAIANELKATGIYPSIRRRPFHIYLTGKPGIGKSILMDTVAREFMAEVIPLVPLQPNYCCTVDCGSRWWNQCNGKQPILIFDDLWSVTQGNVFEEMLVHYLAMHSNIPFTPPKAAVEDKKMFYAPECVISTSNYAFPALNGVDRDAINRRRNMLVAVRSAALKPLEFPECSHCRGISLELVRKSDLSDFHHLEFYIYENVIEEQPIPADAMWITYNDMIEIMIEKAQAHKEKEDEIYDEKIQYFEEKKADIYGHTLEDRLTNEAFIHKNYFERLIDQEIKPIHFSKEIIKKMKKMVKNGIDRIYGLNQIYVEEQNEPVPPIASTSTNDGEELLRANNIFIENKERFKKYLDAVTCSKQNLSKFLRITDEQQMRNKLEAYFIAVICDSEKKNIRKPKITWDDFFKFLKKKFSCFHSGEVFRKTTYIDGHFYDGDRTIPETFRCENWCLMETEFKFQLMNEWLKENAVKKLYLSRRIDSRVPALLMDKNNFKPAGYIALVRAEIEVWSRNMYQKIAENSLIQAVCNFIKNVGTTIWRLIKEWCYILVPLLGVSFISYGLTKSLVREIIPSELNVESQTHNYDAHVIRTARPMEKTVAVAHQGASQQAHAVEILLHSNAVWIIAEYLVDGRLCTRKSRCLMLGMRKMLILKHYLDFFNELQRSRSRVFFYFAYVDPKFRQISGSGRIEIKLLDLPMKQYCYSHDGDSNLIVVELPTTIPAAKDLTKFIASKEEHSYVGRNAWLVQTSELTERVSLSMDDRHTFVVSPGAEKERPVTMYQSYTYDFEGKGICGSVLLAPGLQRPIIGIHVAGQPGVMGIAEPLVRETFIVETERLKDVADLKLNSPYLKDIDLTTTLFPKGTVGVEYAHKQPTVSQYVPSLIHGIFDVKTTPANLGALNDGRTPLEIGASKHGLLSDPFPRKLVEEAKKDLEKKILIAVVPVKREVGVLSLKTAIIGDPLIEEFTPLRWTSSEGFPLVKERPNNVRCKKWLFDLIEMCDGSLELNGIHPRLKQILEMEIAMRKQGIVPVTIFTDVCKDELLPPGKDTRVFSTAPVQFVIAFRMYFGDFMAAYRRARLSAEHGIGVDVNSIEWTKIARYLQQKGPKIIAGDYSHFGYTLNAQFITASFEIIFEWYEKYSESPTLKEDQTVRYCLMNEILNVHRLASNFIYQSACGIPSGFPATDIMNSMVNCLYIRAAWREITRKGFYEFHQNINLLVYGDDIAMNVSDQYADIFNTETLHVFFKQYGIKFTDIDKGDTIIPYRTLKNATFLKCNFRVHEKRPGLYTAALDKTSVEGAANWIHKSDDLVEATIENAKQCLELAHGHGKEYYDYVRDKIEEAVSRKMNKNFIYLDYEEIDSRRYDVIGV